MPHTRRLAVLFLALCPLAVAWPSAAQEPSASCAVPTVDDRCEAWISTDPNISTTASGYPMFYNEQLMAVSPDGSAVFAAGMALSGAIITKAYSTATGAALWSSRFEGIPEFRKGRAESLSLSPDGQHVYVLGIIQQDIGMCVGEAFFANNHGTSVILSYAAATGALEWWARTDAEAPPNTLATCSISAEVSPDGSEIYSTGFQYRRMPDGKVAVDALTTAVDAASGEQLWRRENGDAVQAMKGTRLAQSPDGSMLYVVGTTTMSDDYKVRLLAYELTGPARDRPELAWIQRYPVGGGWLPDVAVDPSGDRVVVIQQRSTPGDGFATWLEVTAHEADDGAVVWSRPVTGPGSPAHADYAFAWHSYQPLAFSPDGRTVYLTGDVAPRYQVADEAIYQSPGGFLTAALDMAAGEREWTSVYRTPTTVGSALGTALVLSPDGKHVFVTGTSMSSLTRLTYLTSTVAYDAESGEQEWVALDLDRPGITDSIAVSPDGSRVFVAGDAVMDRSTTRFYMAVRAFEA